MTLVELLPFAAIAAAFWLLIIRPASVRRKAQAALVASLEPGQQIMTTAGVFGKVVAIDSPRVSVEVAPGVVIEMLAQAVAQVVPADSGAQVADDSTERADARAEDTSQPAELDSAEPAPPAGPGVDEPPANPALTPEVDRG